MNGIADMERTYRTDNIIWISPKSIKRVFQISKDLIAYGKRLDGIFTADCLEDLGIYQLRDEYEKEWIFLEDSDVISVIRKAIHFKESESTFRKGQIYQRCIKALGLYEV